MKHNLHQMPWEHLLAVTSNFLLSQGFVREDSDSWERVHHKSEELSNEVYGRNVSMLNELSTWGWESVDEIADDDYTVTFRHPNGAYLYLQMGPTNAPDTDDIVWQADFWRPDSA